MHCQGKTLADPNSVCGSSLAGWQIGGGVLVNQRPYKGVDPRVIGIPFLMYEGHKWSFKGTRFDYLLAEDNPWSIKALLRLNTDGYDDDDSSSLRGMSDRHITLDAGLQATYAQKWGIISFEALTDTLGVNDGQRLGLSFSQPQRSPFGIEKLTAIPFIGAEWRTTSLNNYYYGVRSKEANSARPAYKASGDIDLIIGFTCSYELNERWSFFGMFNLRWLGDEIQDSPIVDRNYQNTLIGGLLYKF